MNMDLVNLIGDVLAEQPNHAECIDEAMAVAAAICKRWPWIEWFIEWSAIIRKPQQEKQA